MDKKVLDEAVEVAVAASRAHWQSVGIVMNDHSAMRAALLASLPVLLGEPVAWRVRCGPPDGMCSYSFLFTSEKNAKDEGARYGRDGWSAEVAALYAPSLGEGE